MTIELVKNPDILQGLGSKKVIKFLLVLQQKQNM